MTLNRPGLLGLRDRFEQTLIARSPVRNLECESPESSPTPERWNCVGESGDLLSLFSLYRVDPYKSDPVIVKQCEYFQRSGGSTDPEVIPTEE